MNLIFQFEHFFVGYKHPHLTKDNDSFSTIAFKIYCFCWLSSFSKI